MYFFELERRLARSDDGVLTETEKFCGLAFTIDDSNGLENVLMRALDRVKERKGVLAGITVSGSDKALVYTHHFDNNGTLNATARRVLKRLGLIPKKRDSATTTDTASDDSHEE
jgi:hypothetical protein